MAKQRKSLWRIIYDYCGYFRTAIWIVSIIVWLILFFLSMNPLLKGGIGALFLAASLIAIANKIHIERDYPKVLTLGDLRARKSPRSATPIKRLPESEPTKPRDDEVVRKQQIQPIGLFTCHVMNDMGNEVQGAFVTLESDQTGKIYRSVTDRRGGLNLSVPNGSYTLIVKANNHFDRVCAVEVSDPYGTHTQVNLQMMEDERRRVMGERLREIIQQLTMFTRQGTLLMEKIISETEALDDEVSKWEKTVADYLQARWQNVYADIFLSNKDIVEYPMYQGTPFHANLTRVNARVRKLVAMITDLEAQLPRERP